jgi:hypothetical protein
MKKLVLILSAVLAMLVASPAGAADGVTTCNGFITGVHENVVVPPEASCTMAGATVNGNVVVLGDLTVFETTTIHGYLLGKPGHRFVRLVSGAVVVGKDVLLIGGTDPGGSGYGEGVRIDGNFTYVLNAAPLSAFRGTIGRTFSAVLNTGGGSITENVIGGHLICLANNPRMTATGNTVGGLELCSTSATATT